MTDEELDLQIQERETNRIRNLLELGHALKCSVSTIRGLDARFWDRGKLDDLPACIRILEKLERKATALSYELAANPRDLAVRTFRHPSKAAQASNCAIGAHFTIVALNEALELGIEDEGAIRTRLARAVRYIEWAHNRIPRD